MTDDIVELLTTGVDHAETDDLPNDGTDLLPIVRQEVSADWRVPPAAWPERRRSRPTAAHSRSQATRPRLHRATRPASKRPRLAELGPFGLQVRVLDVVDTERGGELKNLVAVLADERLISIGQGNEVPVNVIAMPSMVIDRGSNQRPLSTAPAG